MRWSEGSLTVYVNPAFVWLSLLSAGLLALVALPGLVALQRGHGTIVGHSLGWPAYLLSGLAAALVLFLPPRPLGSAALENQGLETGSGATTLQASGTSAASPLDDTQEWTLFEWTTVWSQAGQRQKLVGRPANLVGFVHHPRAGLLPDDQFMLARFVVRCCTADSNALAMAVHWPEAAALPSDSWVRVGGSLQIDRSGPQERPLIQASEVTPVPRPLNPYLSPTG
jgi:uncharacterized repeat protein (TIGR03943 family)